jgi:hypothetical protein
MVQDKLDLLVHRIIESGLATQDELIGCSEEEIAEFEANHHVALPAFYRGFLMRMGRRAGAFFRGTDILLRRDGYRQWALELLADNNYPFKLPDDAFVFFLHQGYVMGYFICDGSDDPPVFIYSEGRDTTPKRVADHLSDYFLKAADDSIELQNNLQRRREGNAAE